MKVLNLYAGIGGNRKLWKDVEVVAVESDPSIAEVYKDFFPNDEVLCCDAHQYLLQHYQRFDFIWSSPPCPSHGQYRFNVGVRAKGFKAVYPDMKLYEEIILLKHHFNGAYIIENTISYYEPLVQPQKVGRHYIWSNIKLEGIAKRAEGIRSKNKILEMEEERGFDLSGYKLKDKRQILRNCTDSALGLKLFTQARAAMEAKNGK